MYTLPDDVLRLVLAQTLCDSICRVCKHWLWLIDTLPLGVVQEYVDKCMNVARESSRQTSIVRFVRSHTLPYQIVDYNANQYLLPLARFYKSMTLEQQIEIPNILTLDYNGPYIVEYKYPIDWFTVSKAKNFSDLCAQWCTHSFNEIQELYFKHMFTNFEQYRRHILAESFLSVTQTRLAVLSTKDNRGYISYSLLADSIWRTIKLNPTAYAKLLDKISIDI